MTIETQKHKTAYQLNVIQLNINESITKKEVSDYIDELFETKECCVYVSLEAYSKELRGLGFKKYEDGYYLDNNKQSYIYMLRCVNGHLYTGWTNHLHKRISTHLSKGGAKYTKAFGPCELVHYEIFETKQEAMKREYEIKQYTKQEKEALIHE